MRKNSNLIHLGLLVLRIGIGISFFFHGLPKIMGGPEAWEGIGSTMGIVGINFAPAFWGFMAALAETAGGILFATGFLFRPAALMLAFTMIIAMTMHLSSGDTFSTYSHALEALVVFAAAFIAGPGKYSFDYRYLQRIA